MNLSAYYTTNPALDEERFKVLDRAAELGATFWITSDVGDVQGVRDCGCGVIVRLGGDVDWAVSDSWGGVWQAVLPEV